MKTLFIHARSSGDILIGDPVIKKLKGKVGLVTTIQHLHQLKDIQKQIPGSVIGGQILGCSAASAEKISSEVDSFLYIGTGRFHPLNVYYKTKKPVFIYDPLSRTLSKLSKKDLELFEKKKKSAIVKFLSSDNIGILVSTKPGQSRISNAFELKRILKGKGKDCYILVSETIDYSQLENFTFIDIFVNTACPRIFDDDLPKQVINLEDVIELLSEVSK